MSRKGIWDAFNKELDEIGKSSGYDEAMRRRQPEWQTPQMVVLQEIKAELVKLRLVGLGLGILLAVIVVVLVLR